MSRIRRTRRRGSRSWSSTMTDEALEGVLRLLAEGRLTADEAGPIIDALGGGDASSSGDEGTSETSPARADTRPDDRPGRTLRVQVTEKGRTVINLRIPLSL